MAEKFEFLITADDRASGVFERLGGFLGGFGKLAFGVLAAGAAAATGAIVGLGSVLNDAVQSAGESADVISQLEAVLKSTGGVAGVTSKEAQDLASSLQKLTRFSDEQILSGENLLLTFTNIKDDIFPDATKVMLDMSQALGQDLKSSAIQLGKALQDPILGVTALRRVGVNFSDAQQEVIKSLVESGQLEEAQALILKELQKEFGGSAEAAGKTFAGKLDILNNRFDDMKENLGNKVIPVLEMLMDRVVVPLIPYLEKAADVFGNLISKVADSEGFQTFLENASNSVQGLLTGLTNLMLGRPLDLPKLLGFGDTDWGGVAADLTEQISSTLGNIDWNGIIQTVSSSANRIFEWLAEWINGIDWTQLSRDLADGIDAIDWGAAGSNFGHGANALYEALLGAITEIDWGALGNAVAKAIFESMGAAMNEWDPMKWWLEHVVQPLSGLPVPGGTSGLTDAEIAQQQQDLANMLAQQQLGEQYPGKARGGRGSGLTWVGERGPELVDLPAGAYVHNAADSARMGGTQIFNFSFPNYVGSRQELETALRETVRKMQADGSL